MFNRSLPLLRNASRLVHALQSTRETLPDLKFANLLLPTLLLSINQQSSRSTSSRNSVSSKEGFLASEVRCAFKDACCSRNDIYLTRFYILLCTQVMYPLVGAAILFKVTVGQNTATTPCDCVLLAHI